MNPLRATLSSLPLALATTAAGAAGMLDGSEPFVCAVTSTATCERAGECVTGPAESVNLPVLWRVDARNETIESLRHGGERRTSAIVSSRADGGFLVVQGAEGGLGWSLSVEQETGAMVLTGGRERGFVAFGTCAGR